MVAALALLAVAPLALENFVASPDPSFVVEPAKVTEEDRGTRHVMEFTSQTWQGKPWKHSLELYVPKINEFPDKSLLIITGDRGSHDDDLKNAWRLAEISKISVAVLYDIPNQPLFQEKLREDDLIAYSFAKFLETRDDNWPLLFPMTKAASKAMDALETYTQKLGQKTDGFIVTGASKRGWTTWLVGGLGQKRVIGIAPMVFDFLNFPEQLAHQKKIWGKYSPMFQPYVEQGLPQIVGSEAGKALVQRIDPFSYIEKLRLPKLIIAGANDPYWAIDAATIYSDDLQGPKAFLYVPNAGHDLDESKRVLSTLAVFCRMCSQGKTLPKVRGEVNKSITPTPLGMEPDPTRPESADSALYTSGAELIRFWFATSASRNFTESDWQVFGEKVEPSEFAATIPISGRPGFRAAFGEAEFVHDGIRYYLSSLPAIIGGR